MDTILVGIDDYHFKQTKEEQVELKALQRNRMTEENNPLKYHIERWNNQLIVNWFNRGSRGRVTNSMEDEGYKKDPELFEIVSIEKWEEYRTKAVCIFLGSEGNKSKNIRLQKK